jgi:hypothetical protein
VANPVLYFEIGSRSQIDIIMPSFKYSIKPHFEGFRYNPFDLTVMWSLDTVKPLEDPQYCTALQWSTRGMSQVVDTVLDVDECQFGILGAIFGQF